MQEKTYIKVAVRVRPYNRRELEQNQRSVIKVIDQQTLLFDPDEEDDEFFFHGAKQGFRDLTKRVHKKLSMEFDHVFDTESTNQQIFEACTAPLVDSVLNGYNCAVFVYGATGAGKTFTMLGSESCAGITYLTMKDLFVKIEAQKETRKFDVAVSYLEVYNEQVMNLLTKTGPLKLLEDSTGVVVSGLCLKTIRNAEELLDLLLLGNANRTQHPTDANAESSRSHAVFQVHIRITDRKTETKRTVKLSMIDLAGSERAASTKCMGMRFREGANINKSLLALGNCINNLADGQKHIPYRDSNLTRILKDSLSGNCQTLMVANVSQSSLTYEDTYNTLKYASRAKKIRTTLRQNTLKTNMPKEFYIKKVDELMAENIRLKESQKTFEVKMSTLQTSTSQSSTVGTYDEVELKTWYWRIDAVYSPIMKIQENVTQLQSKIKILTYKLKLEEYSESYRKLLSLNRPLLKEDLESFNLMANKILIQIGKHTEEQSLWRKKLQDACNNLEKIKKEISSSKCSEILKVYQNNKELEVELNKQMLKINHINSINTEIVAELKRLNHVCKLSCEALQKYYVHMGTFPDVNDNLDELLEIVHRNTDLVGNEKCKTETETHMDKFLPNGKRAKGVEEESVSSSTKKQKPILPNIGFDADLSLVDDNELGVFNHPHFSSIADNHNFKLPEMPKPQNNNLNETHIILPSTSDDCNKTFFLGSGYEVTEASTLVATPNIQQKAFLKNVLSDNLVQLPQNRKYIQNGLLKAQNFGHRDIKKTIARGTQKENKTNNPKPSCSIVKPKATTSHGTAPVVRTNRAAIFRTKK